MRHHISVIKQLVPKIEQTGKLTAYLDAVDDTQIQISQIRYCDNDFVNILLGLYAGLARQQHTDFIVRAAMPETININEVDLNVMLSNLLENALEASARLPEHQREVSVNIGCELGVLGIFIKNRFDGVLDKKDGRFLSHKQPGRIGVGIASAEDVCKKYGGNVSFYSQTKREPRPGLPGHGRESEDFTKYKETENIFCAKIAIPIWEGGGE